jgi:hypothetical protein
MKLLGICEYVATLGRISLERLVVVPMHSSMIGLMTTAHEEAVGSGKVSNSRFCRGVVPGPGGPFCDILENFLHRFYGNVGFVKALPLIFSELVQYRFWMTDFANTTYATINHYHHHLLLLLDESFRRLHPPLQKKLHRSTGGPFG